MRLLFCLAVGAVLTALVTNTAKAEPKIVLASLQPFTECIDAENPWLESGCVEVPKPMDRITVPCKTKPGMCPLSWGIPKDDDKYWPQQRHASYPRVRRVKGVKKVAGTYVPSQSPVGREIARKLGLQVSQQVGFVVGGPLGAMGFCTGITFVYMVQDGLDAKETWTPIDTVGNLVLSGIGCSPIGFVMRMIQAKTDQERFMALLGGGLGFVNNPVAGVAGQVLTVGQTFIPATTTVKHPR